MKVRATIDFEVDDELIQKTKYKTFSSQDEIEKARADIFHQLVENLKIAETITSYTELMSKTTLYDYNFVVVKEEPLLFEL